MDVNLIDTITEAVMAASCEYIDARLAKATEPLLAKIMELEARPAVKGDRGEPGKSMTLDEVRPVIEEAIAALPKPEDGKSVTIEDVRPVLEGMVASLPVPQDGKDADPAIIKQMVASAVADIPPPRDGKDADPSEVAAMVAGEVQKAIASLPVPEDGKSVTLDDVRPLIENEVAKAVAVLPQPIDGKDGMPGRDGQPGVPGRDGKDGLNGFSLEQFSAEMLDDGQTIQLRFKDASREDVYPLRLAIPIDKGVWRPGDYAKGVSVSYGGCTWIAQQDTSDKPKSSDAWRLAVKCGRDGQDFRPDSPREPSPVKFK